MVCIELDKISKAYDDHQILKEFSLQVEQGDYLAITGESGAGKSTILNIIGLLEHADSGTLRICNVTNPDMSSAKGIQLLRHKIGYLFQNFGLVDDETVAYNLRLATYYKRYDRQAEKKKWSEALAQVGLPGMENRKIYQLSGGEQQRISIAKLLLKSPEIILADEPTGSLDAHNRDTVMQLLKKLNDVGKTILVVTHDEEVRKCAKRSISLSQ